MNIDSVIERGGEQLEFSRRAQDGIDEYGKPIYIWTVVAEEFMFLLPLTSEEVQTLAGQFTIDDVKGFFKTDSIIAYNDRVTWNGLTYEIKAKKTWRISGVVKYIVCYLKEVGA